MNEDRRSAVITSLIELADSADYQDRADAGRALANFAESAESREVLLRLVLDASDTFVTLVTAEALLRREDAAGLAIVAEALGSADVQHLTTIHDAVRTVFMVFATERDRATKACESLLLNPSRQVRQGATELHEMLTELDPLLHPPKPS